MISLLPDVLNSINVDMPSACKSAIEKISILKFGLGVKMILGEYFTISFQRPIAYRQRRISVKAVFRRAFYVAVVSGDVAECH